MRLPVGSDVASPGPPTEALVLGGAARPHAEEETTMTDTTTTARRLDLERALTRYMVERRVSRRQLLERIAAGRARPPPWRRSSPPARRRRGERVTVRSGRRLVGAPARAARPPTAGLRRADAGPAARERAVRLQLDRVHRRGHDPVLREEVRRQGHLRLLLEHRRGRTPSSATTAAATTCSFPISVDIPALRREGRAPAARQVAASRTSSTSARSGRTRATTRATSTRCPYMWWTTGVAYDTDEDHRHADQQQGALGPALRRSTSRCSTTSRRLRGWRSSSSATTPTRRPRPARRGPRAARAAEAAGARVLDRHRRRR